MKTKSKIKRVNLNITGRSEPVIFGIVAAEPDYKLSLDLNRKLGIALKNSDPVIIHDENQSELTFSRFSDFSHPGGIVYEITSNRSGKNCLIKKMKNIDYFFLIHDIDNNDDINRILSLIRQSDLVTAALLIDPDVTNDRNFKYLISAV